jgi:hypothetical protein
LVRHGCRQGTAKPNVRVPERTGSKQNTVSRYARWDCERFPGWAAP